MSQSFIIKSRLDSDVLTYVPRSSSAPIVAQPETGAPTQKWAIISARTPPYYHIKNKHSNVALSDSDATSPSEGSLWRFVPSSIEGYYYIQNKDTGNVMDIKGACKADGTAVITYPRNNPQSNNQIWTLERA